MFNIPLEEEFNFHSPKYVNCTIYTLFLTNHFNEDIKRKSLKY